jgi:hypothetical protein
MQHRGMRAGSSLPKKLSSRERTLERIRGMPVRGRYTFTGDTIMFHYPRGIEPNRRFQLRLGRFTLWTARQLAECAKIGKTPEDVSYQVR